MTLLLLQGSCSFDESNEPKLTYLLLRGAALRSQRGLNRLKQSATIHILVRWLFIERR